jgi:hypothetical protein
MPPRILHFFSILAIFFVVAAPLFRELSRRSDIWWTPYAMRVPLADSKDRVEIYARGKPLMALLQARQLRIAEDGALDTLATSDVGLRFNNWDRVRAQRLPLMLVYAAACGAMACLFLLLLTGRLAYRGERDDKPGAQSSAS